MCALFDGTKVGAPMFTRKGPLNIPVHAAGPQRYFHRSSQWVVALDIVRPRMRQITAKATAGS